MKISCFWTFFFSMFFSFGLTQVPEDLERRLNTAVDDRDRMLVLGDVAIHFDKTNQDSALHYYDLAIRLARSLNSDDDILLYINNMSSILLSYQKYDEADSLLSTIDQLQITKSSIQQQVSNLQNRAIANKGLGNMEVAKDLLNEAKSLAQQSDTLQRLIPSILLDLGSVYYSEGNFASSSSHLLEAIEYYKKDESWNNVAVTYLNLAMNNMGIEDFEKANEHAKQGLIYSERSDVPIYLAHSYLTLTAISSELGNHDDALNYGLKSIDSWRDLGNPYQLGLSNRFVGKVLKNKAEYQNSISYLRSSENSFRSIDVKDQLIYSLLELGESLSMTNRKEEGLLKIEEAEMIMEDIPNRNLDLLNIYKLFELGFSSVGNYTSAYAYRKEHDIIKDSIFQEERISQIARLETEFEVSQKEAQLEIQKSQIDRQRIILIGAIVFGGLILLLSIMIWRNLVQRKKVNEELVRLDESKSRFFANISHELRTPLTLIIGPLEKAITKIKSDNALKGDISLALSNSNQLLSLVNEIMDLSKVESGKLSLDISDVNLYKLTNRILAAFESMAEIKKVHTKLDYQLDKGLTTALDIPKYEKILNNLISNAIKFTPSDGTVTLTVKSENNNVVEISVADTGPGIAQEHLEKVFDRFYQGSDSGAYQGGTGIGLALSKELSHLHGGRLSVSSVVNKGSTFSLSLPLTLSKGGNHAIDEITESEFAPKDEYQPVLALGKKSHILIVDDHEAMRTYLKDILSPHYKLTFAHDGIEALEKTELEQFDAITCDVMMPRMDGFEFLKTLRSREMKTHVPVILLTARTLEEDKLLGLRLGTDDYITKPFNTKELVARIENLIRNKASREEENVDEVEELESADLKLLKAAEEYIATNISNEKYGVNELAADMNYSNRQLSRIVKKLTGFSSNQFIREIRLQKAHHLLSHKKYATISEVRFAVGIPHASYFSREFERRFGLKPSEVG